MNATEYSLVCFALFATLGLLAYVIVPKRKWIVLLVSSYFLIFILTSYWLIFLFLSTLIVYLCGILISNKNKEFELKKLDLTKEDRKLLKATYKKKEKLICAIGIICNFLILALLKYFHLNIRAINDFFSQYSLFDISFPILGISYYTLMSVGYLVDVYRNKYDAEKNFFKLSLFVSFFPCQIEGPIGRFDKTGKDLLKNDNPTMNDLSEGLLLICWGLFKKLVIADRINIIVSSVFINYNEYSGIIVFLGMVCFAIQLYADFSGYINIAMGVSRLFGIRLEDNFNRPFLSKSVGEFWRRWHISLGAWLRDYIFYPIALSKIYMNLNKKLHNHLKPFAQKMIASLVPMFFVWLICGIWHGAGFKYIVYGMYYFVIILIEMLLEPLTNKLNPGNKLINVGKILITNLIVVVGLTMFKCTSLTHFGLMIAQLFKGGTVNIIDEVISMPDIIVLIAAVLLLFGYEICKELNINFDSLIINGNYIYRYIIFVLFVIIIVIFGAYGPHYAPVDPMYAFY